MRIELKVKVGRTDGGIRMELLVIQHDSVVGPGLIREISTKAGVKLRVVRLFKNEPLPLDDFTAGRFAGVVGLGSAATAYLPKTNPQHEQEENFFRLLAEGASPSFLMCYSMQLFCQANGGKVEPNQKGKEVGFGEVSILNEEEDEPLLRGMRSPFCAFQSHGDIVSRLPSGARRLAYSDLTSNQVAVYRSIHYLVQFDSQLVEKDTFAKWTAQREAWTRSAGLERAQLLREWESKRKNVEADFRQMFSNFLELCGQYWHAD